MALQNAFNNLATEPKQDDIISAIGDNGAQQNFISVNNSRGAATLAAGATFTGVGEDVSAWGRAGVSITSDNATDGTLYLEVSHDGVTYGGPPREWSDTRFAQPHMWNIVEKYFRIRYVNGSTEATNLSIQTQYSVNESILLGHQLNETLLDETEAIVARTVNTTKDPNDNYINTRAGGVSTRNSTITPLLADEEFNGTILDLRGFTSMLIVVVSSTPLSALEIQWYDDDGATPDPGFLTTTSFTNSEQEIGGTYVYLKNVGVMTAPFYRVHAKNTDTDQLFFQIKTILSDKTIPGETQSLADAITSFTQLTATKAISHGLTTAGDVIAQSLTNLGGDVTQLVDDSSGARRSVTATTEGAKTYLDTKVRQIDTAVDFESPTKRQFGQLNVSDSSATLIPYPNFTPLNLTMTNPTTDTNIYIGGSNVTSSNGDVLLPSVKDSFDYTGEDGIYARLASGGGASATRNLNADTLDSSSGATSPSSMFTSNNIYTTFANASDTATISGFEGTANLILDSITSIKLKMEAQKTADTYEQVTYIDTVGTDKDNSVFITSPTVTANSDHTYIIAVSRRDDGASITSMSSTMGFDSFTQLGEANDGSESRTTVFMAVGTPTSDGTITANFSTGADHEVITVTRLANVLSVNDSGTDTGSDDAYSVGLEALEGGLTYIAAGNELRSHTATSGYTEQYDAGSTASGDQSQAILTRQNTTSGTKAITGTFSGNCKHSVVAISFAPDAPIDPVVQVSHSQGDTALNAVLSETSDTTYTQDITGDETWTPAIIDAMTLTISPTTIGTPDAKVDRVWLEVVEASGTSILTYRWLGK